MQQLHQLLKLTRTLYVYDTETTGIDSSVDRICEIGFQKWGPDGLIDEWRGYINPTIPIPPEATAVHGITDEMVKDAPTFADVAPGMAKKMIDCDFGGQNIRFDLRLTAAEMRRAKFPQWHYRGARVIDSYRLETLLYPKDLSTLYEKYSGSKHDGAHGALADVKASAVVLGGQLTKHAHLLAMSLDQLHEHQWPGWIDVEGLFSMVKGVPTVNFGKWKGRPMKKVDRDYWVWMSGSKSTFSDEVKQIAAKAALGEFPKEAAK